MILLVDGINASYVAENPVSDLSANVSVLAFLTSRSSKNLQLKSTENIINPSAAPETQPDIDGAILHVKPAFDTALSPQDSLQATTTQCFTNVLNLDSDNQQSQLPAIENPLSPEPK